MKIKEIMTSQPEVVSPKSALSDAAAKMRDLDIGCLLVCDSDRLVGIITDRDIVIRALANNADCSRFTVGDIVTPTAVYCFEDQDIGEVARIMESKSVRRLAVLNGNKRLVGLVSIDDIAKGSFLAGEILSMVSHSRSQKKAA